MKFETQFNTFFPDLTEIALDPAEYGASNADEYIRKSYHGGWCYLVRGKENKIYHNGTTADVNSLYPSMMSSESGNKYPSGLPKFWKGDIPEMAKGINTYFFIRFRCRFFIKENMLPFVQIKNSFLYKPTDMLDTSDIWDYDKQDYCNGYYDKDNVWHPAVVELTMTETDWQLFSEHYFVNDLEILDGCWFFTVSDIFDIYINKYKKIKMESTGAKRELAKLFLNNLYGKMASSTNSSFKVVYLKPDGSLGFYTVFENNKNAGYIAVGSAITSYARNFTIRHAQANYHGVNERGFIYADTDSIHCDLLPEEIQKCRIDNNNFCCWKLESCWDDAIFVRQKTYIEHVIMENLEAIDEPYYNIKCAGMPQRCKDLFEMSMTGYKAKEGEKFTEEEKEFLHVQRTMYDFKCGLKVPSKLLPKQIKGGVLLKETTYEMRY